MLLCLAVSVLLHHLTDLRMYSHLLYKEPSVTWSHSTRERVSVCVCVYTQPQAYSFSQTSQKTKLEYW